MKKIFLLALILVFCLFAYRYYLNLQEINQLKLRIKELNAEIKMAQQEQEELLAELKNVDNPEYIERVAREELGLVKPGELLLIPVEAGDNNLKN